ncbi:MAG TPA: peptidoglycan-associated lipoprotein Pal [Geothermobacteraceae bacterium]|nr:peptidoglycan-associated lipoprotein Pal [Geothermobacteraceae bacterium]
MKKINPGNLLALALLCTLLSTGCAKKLVADITPVADQPEVVAAPDPISTVQDAAIEAEAAGDQQEGIVATPLVVELEMIHFAFDQHTLSAESREILTKNAVLLQTNPQLNIDIEGHCDERGSDEYNLALGERRAQAAKDYLVTLGVAPERVATISYGEEIPLDPSAGEDAWAKNRRAAFRLQN